MPTIQTLFTWRQTWGSIAPWIEEIHGRRFGPRSQRLRKSQNALQRVRGHVRTEEFHPVVCRRPLGLQRLRSRQMILCAERSKLSTPMVIPWVYLTDTPELK